MSDHVRRSMRGIGASALAVATIAFGLSSGAASAAAAPQPRVTAVPGATFQLIHEWSPSLGVTEWGAMDATGRRVTYASEALAKANAPFWTIYEWDGNSNKLTINLASDLSKCLGVFVVDTSHATIVRSGSVCNVAPQASTSGSVWRIESGNLRWVPFSTPGFLTGRPSQDISGTGGRFDVTRENMRFSSLPTDLLSPTPARSFTAVGAFPADVTKAATVSGTAAPNTRIELADNGSAVVGSTTSTASGAWSIDVPAGGRRGLYTVHARQIVSGQSVGHVRVDLDYGAGVAITGPEDGDVLTGPTAITGTGAPGTTVDVFDDGSQDPIVSTTVRSNGTWSGAANLNAGEHVLEAKQLSKGANTTTSTITVNPGEAAVDFTAAGRFDAQDVTKPAVAHGSAAAGSTVILRNSVGTEIGRAVAGADDTYQITIDPTKATSGVNTFSAIVQGDAGNAKSFTLDYGMPAAPVVVTTPALNGTVEPGTVRFAGTGQADSKIVVRGSVRQVATATVNAQGAWAGNSTVQLDKGSYNLYFDQTSKGGLKRTIQHAFTVSDEAFRELTLSAPAQDATVTVLRPTFAGTATPHAQIRVGSSRTTVATATVRADGTWRATADFDLARGGTYAGLEVRQTSSAGETSTVSASFTVDRNAQ